MSAKKESPEKELAHPLDRLREPFPAHQVSKLPKPTKAQTDAVKADFKKGVRCMVCGGWHHPDVVHLDYVGHAALTDRLLDTDRNWSWEPVAFRDGLPAFDASGGLWIKLTVCDVTRLGYGHAAAKPGVDPGAREKEVIGDALRNAAMRFGAALDLWHKGDLHVSDDAEPDQKVEQKKPTQEQKPKADAVPTLVQRAERFEATLRSQNDTVALEKAWRLGASLCAKLDTDDPERLVELQALYNTLEDEILTRKAAEAEEMDPFQ